MAPNTTVATEFTENAATTKTGEYDMTNNNVVSWIVEEKDNTTGAVKTQSFNSYDEALDMYNYLKLLNENSFVSIQKNEKKLLVE